jgi:hypothetical protein
MKIWQISRTVGTRNSKPRKFEKHKLVSLGFFTSHTNIVELIACEMNYKSLSIVIINSYINDNYESPMNQPINNNGSHLTEDTC